MGLDLQLIGVPVSYRSTNPFALSPEQKLDAYPSRAPADAVNIWMSILGDETSQPAHGWSVLLEDFVRECESRGVAPFPPDYARRNRDEHVRGFLQQRRRRVRDYLDRTSLLKLPVWDAVHSYERFEHSWRLHSALQLRKVSTALAIGKALELDQRWTRTHYTRYPATWTWHRWLQYGVCRVGWSANSSTSWLWYEINCPELPGIAVARSGRDMDAESFTRHLDDLWLPLVHSARFWSSSNPKIWDF